MTATYSDQDIENLVREPKPLPQDYRTRVRLKDKRGHKEQELDISGTLGNQFRLILRQSNFNVLDFSIILAACPANTNLVFRLRRYNGKSHEHTNLIEGNTFYDFHIHEATARYQELGTWEDAFAEQTDSYADYHGAVQHMLSVCGFVMPREDQMPLL